MKSVTKWILYWGLVVLAFGLSACQPNVAPTANLTQAIPTLTPIAPTPTAVESVAQLATVAPATATPSAYTCPADQVNPLPLPPTPAANSNAIDAYAPFNQEMYLFLMNKCYEQYEQSAENQAKVTAVTATPGWLKDKGIRNVGPFIDNEPYMVHPAVSIYYSPQASEWLMNGRQGDPPDGAMMIKVMYQAPANQYGGLTPTPDLNSPQFYGWSLMLRDSQASQDGWYWGGFGISAPPPADQYPFAEYPYGGFGQIAACLRCHASAEADSFTFSDLRNVEFHANIPGTEEDPINYVIDNSWRTPQATGVPAATATPQPVLQPNAEFLGQYPQLTAVSPSLVTPLPPRTYDVLVAGTSADAHTPEQFLTSNQCSTCHGGLSGKPFGPTMYLPPPGDLNENIVESHHLPSDPHSSLPPGLAGQGVNLSPAGEWRWSMMGLAGRDPVFYAQLQSEMNLHPANEIPELVQNTCLRCHGVMGQRQFHLDNGDAIPYLKENAFETTKYGGLSRDGISCMVCHQIADQGELQDTDVGRFIVPTPTAGEITVNGPFSDPRTLPMQSSMGIVPAQNDFIQDSKLCASCHTIRLPAFDADNNLLTTKEDPTLPFQLFEQATYLEWVNSAFADTTSGQFRSCQDCHMPKTFPYNPDATADQELSFDIAAIQNQLYPFYDHQAPLTDITINPREGYARHSLHGINIFVLEMFNQFDQLLGVIKSDYMTGSTSDLAFATASYTQFAEQNTANVVLSAPKITTNTAGNEVLEAEVTVTNATGHRFPSGVGFRRAFIQFQVLDSNNNVVWASGNTNALGVIVGADGQPLPSEFHGVDSNGRQAIQPHYEVITNTQQVQIYEELTMDPQNQLTTSFVSRCYNIKDNRLFPLGWQEAPPNFPEYEASYPSLGDLPATIPTKPNTICEEEDSLHATFAVGTGDDPDYQNGSGQDAILYQIPLTALPAGVAETGTVVATLYYQSIPPSFLADRFANGRQGGGEAMSDAERLYYLASNVNLQGTAVENWKLFIARDVQAIGGGSSQIPAGNGRWVGASLTLGLVAFAFVRRRW